MNKKIEYSSFFPKQKTFWGGNCLFRVAEDHFLYTELTAYREEYKRFFFADIIAIKFIKQRDWTFIIAIAVLCMTSVMFVMLGVVDGDYYTGGIVMFLIGIAPLIIALYCLWAGFPVETIIKTAYSSDRVMFGRIKQAEKNLQKMVEYLEEVQNVQLDEAALVEMDATEKVFKV
jgi:hypothetical protein